MAKKVLKKILFVLVIAMVVLYGATYLFMFLGGKALIISKLEELTHRKVTMGYFMVTPPFNLEIKKLNINGIATIDSLSLSPSFISLLTGKLALSQVKLVRPEFTYEKSAPARPSQASLDAAAPAPASAPAQPIKIPPALIFEHLVIKDGKLHFIDHSAGTDGIIIHAKNINFNLSNSYAFPFSLVTRFNLKARIPWKEGAEEGKVAAEGWLDFSKRDMQADLNIRDIDGIYLYPYYSQWVDLEKARIQSAKLSFTSKIRGQDNNIVAENHLVLTDIVRKPRPAEEPQEKAEKIADAVLDAFKIMNNGKIELNFTIRTKMDRPQFGFNLVKSAVENKLALARNSRGFGPEEVVIIPAKLIGGTVKGATGFSKALLQGTLVFVKEIKKSVVDSFRKHPSPDPAACPAPAGEEKKE